jgi:hypothetical protein
MAESCGCQRPCQCREGEAESTAIPSIRDREISISQGGCHGSKNAPKNAQMSPLGRAASRHLNCSVEGRKSAFQHAGEEFYIFSETGIRLDQFLNLADGVNHRRVIAAAEGPADFR